MAPPQILSDLFTRLPHFWSHTVCESLSNLRACTSRTSTGFLLASCSHEQNRIMLWLFFSFQMLYHSNQNSDKIQRVLHGGGAFFGQSASVDAAGSCNTPYGHYNEIGSLFLARLRQPTCLLPKSFLHLFCKTV